ncbi:unnamed protein product, partial [Mesorhabditis spiculigera]
MPCYLDPRRVQSEPSLCAPPLVEPYSRILPGTLIIVGSCLGLEFIGDSPSEVKVEVMSVDDTQMEVAQDDYMDIDHVDDAAELLANVTLNYNDNNPNYHNHHGYN